MADFCYSNNFEEITEIGSGGFGKVFKVKDKVDQQMYAIKQVYIRDDEKREKILNEVKILATLNVDKVVRYMHSWKENNLLFIKMEYCSDNLDNIINQKRDYFNRKETEVINNVIEYYLSLKMLRELLECVQYLHGLKPYIIHRDIKPQNILISKNNTNHFCLKLCDFGLAISAETSIYASSVGTIKYIAPEVSKGKYNYMADIYSLGIVAGDIFDIDVNDTIFIENTELNEKLNFMANIIASMIETKISKRPKCDQILSLFGKLWPKRSEIKNNLKSISSNIPKETIFYDYLENNYQIDEIDSNSNKNSEQEDLLMKELNISDEIKNDSFPNYSIEKTNSKETVPTYNTQYSFSADQLNSFANETKTNVYDGTINPELSKNEVKLENNKHSTYPYADRKQSETFSAREDDSSEDDESENNDGCHGNSESIGDSEKSNYPLPDYQLPNYQLPDYQPPNYQLPNYRLLNYPTNIFPNYMREFNKSYIERSKSMQEELKNRFNRNK